MFSFSSSTSIFSAMVLLITKPFLRSDISIFRTPNNLPSGVLVYSSSFTNKLFKNVDFPLPGDLRKVNMIVLNTTPKALCQIHKPICKTLSAKMAHQHRFQAGRKYCKQETNRVIVYRKIIFGFRNIIMNHIVKQLKYISEYIFGFNIGNEKKIVVRHRYAAVLFLSPEIISI